MVVGIDQMARLILLNGPPGVGKQFADQDRRLHAIRQLVGGVTASELRRAAVTEEALAAVDRLAAMAADDPNAKVRKEAALACSVRF